MQIAHTISKSSLYSLPIIFRRISSHKKGGEHIDALFLRCSRHVKESGHGLEIAAPALLGEAWAVRSVSSPTLHTNMISEIRPLLLLFLIMPLNAACSLLR